jgi:hypothetical protein
MQKYQFDNYLEGLGMENVGIFDSHWDNLTEIWYLLAVWYLMAIWYSF